MALNVSNLVRLRTTFTGRHEMKCVSFFSPNVDEQHKCDIVQWDGGSQWSAATVGPPAPPTCSGPEGLVGLELSRLDSTFFRGLGACELSLSNDVHLFTGKGLPVGSSKPLVRSQERGPNKQWRGTTTTKYKKKKKWEMSVKTWMSTRCSAPANEQTAAVDGTRQDACTLAESKRGQTLMSMPISFCSPRITVMNY